MPVTGFGSLNEACVVTAMRSLYCHVPIGMKYVL